jgi:hypothetical protein
MGLFMDMNSSLKARDVALDQATKQQVRELSEAKGHLARLVELAEANPGGGDGTSPGGRGTQ